MRFFGKSETCRAPERPSRKTVTFGCRTGLPAGPAFHFAVAQPNRFMDRQEDLSYEKMRLPRLYLSNRKSKIAN
jgi:hypothetical protein